MSLSPGTKLGVYEIVDALGAGGMGEVYRARDTKLKREVAIKVLPETFARDPDRLARFHREAELLATLSHTNIAGVYGFEDSAAAPALVLELVEGPTLTDRIARGPIPIDEALPIAYEIADALEAAHQRGVIHRDLKPANIKLTLGGTVKVLDFGLAKMLEIEGASSMLSMSPTLSVHATFAGVILGTAAYMSPEQARGRQVDKRTDVWAFACVLYEMLTGRRAFDGEDVTETLGAVVHKEPALDALPAATPASVRTTLERCFQKDPKQRIRDIGDVRLALGGAFESRGAAAQPTSVRPSRRRLIAVVASSVVAASIITAIGAFTMLRPTTKPARIARFAIVPPVAAQFLPSQLQDRDIAISPEGTHIVYRGAGSGQIRLFVRAIDQLDAQPLSPNNSPRAPFFSPDGRWVGFFEAGELRKVSITGGPSIPVCRLNAQMRGASWGSDDTIVFTTSDPATGLMSVAAGGGEPKVLTKPDMTRGEVDHLFPFVLPNGRGVLFTIVARSAENAQIAVFDPKTGDTKILVRGGSQAEYAETGHLVYAASGALRSVRFDLARLQVMSDPMAVVEHVLMSATGAAQFALSQSGTLVYVPGGIGSGEGALRSLVWVNRHGQEQPLKAPPRVYMLPRLSPDGTRIALQIADQEQDIWVWDLKRETLTRLTFDPANEALPVWTPDSRRIVFNSVRTGGTNVFWHAADGTGADERLTTSANPQNPFSITPDGKYLLLGEVAPKTLAASFGSS